jgi:uncharacterized protein
LFDRYFGQKRYEGSECTFTNLYMWRKVYGIEWAQENECICVKASSGGKTFVLPPLGSEAGYGAALDAMLDYFTQNNLPFLMKTTPRWMKKIIEDSKPGVFVFQEDQSNYDYVYNAEDLIELKGRKYSRKRNHIKNFKEEYPNYQYVPLTDDLIQDCIDNEVEWCEKRNCDEDPGLSCEKYAIMEALTKFTKLGYKGGIILIDEKIEAFTFGEMINEDTAVIHVEKGNPDIKGIYPVINQEFCQNTWQGVKYINREEDMGIEGLKKAKESYYPVMLIEKFDVRLKGQ